MPETLGQLFQQAQADVVQLPKAPDNLVKLTLYGLYKQALEGDCLGKRPKAIDFVGRAKYDTWKSYFGLSQEEAQQRYVELVNQLKEEAMVE